METVFSDEKVPVFDLCDEVQGNDDENSINQAAKNHLILRGFCYDI